MLSQGVDCNALIKSGSLQGVYSSAPCKISDFTVLSSVLAINSRYFCRRICRQSSLTNRRLA